MHIYIASRQRHDKIITPIPHEWMHRAYLVVHESERDLYQEYNPTFNIITHTKDNLTDIRQWLHEHTQTRYVVHLDDDLSFFARQGATRSLKKATMADVADMFTEMEFLLVAMGYAQVGIGRRLWSNTKEDYEYWGPVSSIYGINTDILYQEKIQMAHDRYPTSQDTFLTLSLLSQGYPNIICYRWAHTNGINQAGGCAAYRTLDMRQKAAESLAEDFPDYVTLLHPAKDEQMRKANFRVSWAKMKKVWQG